MAKSKPKSSTKSKPENSAKKDTGRPSKYQPDFAKKALKLCRLGATDPDLANFFEVTVSTISKWKLDYPDFSEALKEGKDLADAEVANKLFKRATGYKHNAVKMFNHMGTVISKEYIEHYPPDTTACIFWLKNRQPAKWRDKPEGSTGNASVPELLREIADRLPD